MTAPTPTHHCNPPFRVHARSGGVEAGHVEGTLVVVESRLCLVECQLHLCHPTTNKNHNHKCTRPLEKKNKTTKKNWSGGERVRSGAPTSSVVLPHTERDTPPDFLRRPPTYSNTTRTTHTTHTNPKRHKRQKRVLALLMHACVLVLHVCLSEERCTCACASDTRSGARAPVPLTRGAVERGCTCACASDTPLLLPLVSAFASALRQLWL